MKKDEAERAIRYLCHEWEKTQPQQALEHPSFSDFTSWLSSNGYSHYLDFRSVMGARYDAEMWFDQEFKQTWRR
ncbi:hypothetical protein F9K77_14070 [Ochrobactrum sp. LMG 5442]|uniref:hypothetical protein n=1 Tax=Brucella intermedia TaxID=94625 RepID=UPI00124C30F2|nr:hypothetical protein [Brucella intermedia]KAB2671079.1 hypothetical protein F9K77_14070 [Ochrobactrum sp. LMG 5442]